MRAKTLGARSTACEMALLMKPPALPGCLPRVPILARGSLLFLGIIAHPTTKGAAVRVEKKVQQESRIGLVRK
jgi:hypothetical protein